LPRTKKQKHRPPTVEEMLQFRPRRVDFEWTTKTDGLVQIKVPKFTSKFGKSFCNIIKKDNSFTANMDKIGSVVWKNCNGKNSVKEILDILKKEFPKEENIDNRLYLFLQQMHSLHYIML
jgi:hypothetical protein